MDIQRPRPNFSPPPPFSLTAPPPPQPFQGLQMTPMDVEMSMSDVDRTQRAASVLSGMSDEDIEAANTLNSLHASELDLLHALQYFLSLMSNRVALVASAATAANTSSHDHLIQF